MLNLFTPPEPVNDKVSETENDKVAGEELPPPPPHISHLCPMRMPMRYGQGERDMTHDW